MVVLEVGPLQRIEEVHLLQTNENSHQNSEAIGPESYTRRSDFFLENKASTHHRGDGEELDNRVP